MIDLDLDALVEQKYSIKLGGEVLNVVPPTLEQLINILGYAKKLEGVGGDVEPQAVSEAFDGLKGFVAECIPELGDKKINLRQLIALVQYIVKISSPDDVKALEDNGIKLNTQKKIEQK
jgi:hypothetical protein